MTSQEVMEKVATILPVVLTSSRVRRGELHDVVCSTLKITKSNHHVKLIKAVLAAQGVRAVTIHGKHFYANYPPQET